jgi:hypothetical protein
VAARAGRSRRAARRVRLAAGRVGRGGRGAAGAAARDRGTGGNRRGARVARRAPAPERRLVLGLADPGLGLLRRCRLCGRRVLARRWAPLRGRPPFRRPGQLPAGAKHARALGRAARARAPHALAGADRDLRRGSLPHGRHRLGARRQGVRRPVLFRVRVERAPAPHRHPRGARLELGEKPGDVRPCRCATRVDRGRHRHLPTRTRPRPAPPRASRTCAVARGRLRSAPPPRRRSARRGSRRRGSRSA